VLTIWPARDLINSFSPVDRKLDYQIPPLYPVGDKEGRGKRLEDDIAIDIHTYTYMHAL